MAVESKINNAKVQSYENALNSGYAPNNGIYTPAFIYAVLSGKICHVAVCLIFLFSHVAKTSTAFAGSAVNMKQTNVRTIANAL